MALPRDEIIHFIITIFCALLIYKSFSTRINKKNVRVLFATAIFAGFLVDIDHLFDYFIAYGFNFNLKYFLKGYQFLRIDKFYLPLHSFELVVISLAVYLLKQRGAGETFKIILLTFALVLFSHSITDIYLNQIPASSYFFIYRLQKKFILKDLISDKLYQEHLKQKEIFKNY